MAPETVPDMRQRIGVYEHLAAREVDFVFERERHGLRGERFFEVAVVGDDAGDVRRAARGERDDRIAAAHDAGCDLAAVPAEVGIGTQHVLHREPEVVQVDVEVDRDGFEEVQQRGSRVPGHAGAGVDDVVAFERRERDTLQVGDVEVLCLDPGPVFADDLAEPCLGVVDEVHFVYGQYDVADPEQRDQVAVAACLRNDARAGVDQNDGQIGRRAAGDHVARVLFVSRGVGDDELAAIGGEVAVGDVDGDSLFAFGFRPSHSRA